ncbi:MAG: hypothetical protein DYG89_45740 [Caldilinea sp. CFX5]|nr:hypothetical protein [Caldilinea sp. CFX5]
MMQFINAIFRATPGMSVGNQFLLPNFLAAIERLNLAQDERKKLMESVHYFLVGKRNRQSVPNLLTLQTFSERAATFELGVEEALDTLAQQINQRVTEAGITFDAIITTTTTGNLMPGISYRLAAKLPQLVRTDSLLFDLGNVGCTGSLKALKLATQLQSNHKHILVVAVELPSTLIDLTATSLDIWQGNCTFGDGAVALWLSPDPTLGEMALRVMDIRYWQYTTPGLKQIYWDYSSAYYSFRLDDVTTFEQNVRNFVAASLQTVDGAKLQSPYWAIHPAGIALLLRLSRKLGLPKETLNQSVAHYEQYSNMSSASLFHILQDVALDAPSGAPINLLTMGAGFNVIYGYLQKER